MNIAHNRILSPIEIDNSKYRCEYVVIGSGAGGSVAAMELSEAGKDVIVLEEGLYFDSSDFKNDISNMTKASWRNSGVTPFWGKPPIGFAEGRCVGGSTVINGGLIWRTPEHILDLWKKYFGFSDNTIDSMIGHYEKIESILDVSYHRSDNQNKDSDKIANGCDALGWKYVPVPRAGGAKCVNSNLCPTGCPTDAKQSTALTYLPRALKHSCQIFTGTKAIRVNLLGKSITVDATTTQKGERKKVTIESDYVFLAGGAIQTPHLIRKSKINSFAGKNLEFHINLKFVAEFDNAINSQKGTIFTTQVQEFQNQDLLIMASNYRKNYLGMTMAHFNNNTINKVMERYNYCGLYVAQLRAESKGKVYSGFREPIVTYSFDERDMIKIKDSIKKTVRLLFHSGAKTIYLPVKGSKPIFNPDGHYFRGILKNLKKEQLEMITVHAMSSNPIKEKNRKFIDKSNRIGKHNIYITDASILPSNIGESPQGTIMAMAHEITSRHLSE